jgi:hypothetical protein
MCNLPKPKWIILALIPGLAIVAVGVVQALSG